MTEDNDAVENSTPYIVITKIGWKDYRRIFTGCVGAIAGEMKSVVEKDFSDIKGWYRQNKGIR